MYSIRIKKRRKKNINLGIISEESIASSLSVINSQVFMVISL